MLDFIQNNITGFLEIIVALWGVYETRRQTNMMPPPKQPKGQVVPKIKKWWFSPPIFALVSLCLLGWSPKIIDYAQSQYFVPTTPQQTFTDQTFSDQTILLDDKSYSHCVFYNVTFEYDGGPVWFSYNEIHGAIFTSKDIRIASAFDFMAKIGMTKVPELDSSGNPVAPGAIWSQ